MVVHAPYTAIWYSYRTQWMGTLYKSNVLVDCVAFPPIRCCKIIIIIVIIIIKPRVF